MYSIGVGIYHGRFVRGTVVQGEWPGGQVDVSIKLERDCSCKEYPNHTNRLEASADPEAVCHGAEYKKG